MRVCLTMLAILVATAGAQAQGSFSDPTWPFSDPRSLGPGLPPPPPGQVRAEICIQNISTVRIRGDIGRQLGTGRFILEPRSLSCARTFRRPTETLMARVEEFRDGAWREVCERQAIATEYGHLVVSGTAGRLACSGP